MDNVQRLHRQSKKASIYAQTVSCASSSTLVEQIISTSQVPVLLEKPCPSLSQLSKPLLSTISAHLDSVSNICLQSVNRHFRKMIDVDRAHLSICARYVLACRLREGDTSKSGPFSTCVLCKTSQHKTRHSADQTRYLYEPQRKPAKWMARALDRIPWRVRRRITLDADLNGRYLYQVQKSKRPRCYAHLMDQFATDPEVEALMPLLRLPRERPVWLAFTVLRCMHCGKCIAEGDTCLEGCVDCKCDFCPRAPDYRFRRCSGYV